MTLEQAIAKIQTDWAVSRKAQSGITSEYSSPKIEAVWCGKSDTAGMYEVDEEWIGVTEGGKIAWAYASGCSCWDGDFSEERFASMKEVTLSQTHNTPEAWEACIIKFAETGIMQDMTGVAKSNY